MYEDAAIEVGSGKWSFIINMLPSIITQCGQRW
jgi:hypothetical protein